MEKTPFNENNIGVASQNPEVYKLVWNKTK